MIADLFQIQMPLVGPGVKTLVPPQTSINLALYGLTKLFTYRILPMDMGLLRLLLLTGFMKFTGLMGLKVCCHRITHYLVLL